MSKKKGNLIEQHIDKIVLGVIALLSLYLIWAMVIANPYGDQAPGRIDTQNQRRAEDLERRLKGTSEWTDPARQNQLALYEDLIDCSIGSVNTDVKIALPWTPREMIDEEREYPVPEIVAVSDVRVQSIRGAAYLPVEEVRPDLPYDTISTNLGDLDMVTVSARVNLQNLYQNFQRSFMGPRLKVTWKSAEYATPVVAQVELQRRHLLKDGTWSEWLTVSRPKTDPFRKQVDELPLQMDQLQYSGGTSLLMAQFRDQAKQVQILQPRAYDFATWKVPYWIPPEYYKEYLDRLQRLEDEARRELRNPPGGMEATPDGRGGNPRGGRETQPPMRRNNPRDNRRGGGRPGEEMIPGGGIMAGAEGDGRQGTRTPMPEEVLRDARQDIMDGRTDLWSLTKALVWAHDDTVAPGNTYQYRMRIGVFNPIAGKSWFPPEQEEYQNHVVLQGRFSEPTSEVVIPRMLQVFPMEMVAQQPGAMEVEIARYYMGKWQSHEFTVYPGQTIGAKVEQEAPSVTPADGGVGAMPPMVGRDMGMQPMAMGAAGTGVPEMVDYSTGFVFLDTMPRVEWSGPPTIRQQQFYEMMYLESGSEIASLPIGNRNWPREMQSEYTSVKSAEREAATMQYLPRSTGAGGAMPGMPGREGMGREGMGREGMGREGMGREGMGRPRMPM